MPFAKYIAKTRRAILRVKVCAHRCTLGYSLFKPVDTLQDFLDGKENTSCGIDLNGWSARIFKVDISPEALEKSSAAHS
jgi:hypothetical protein